MAPRGNLNRSRLAGEYPEAMAPYLEAAGFTPTPKGLVRYA